MEKTPPPEVNRVRVSGLLQNLRQRWTPDGSLAVIADLASNRPALGPVRSGVQTLQPLPVRASGDVAKAMVELDGRDVVVDGCLRRRYYSRDGVPSWGQVEIWADACRLEQ